MKIFLFKKIGLLLKKIVINLIKNLNTFFVSFYEIVKYCKLKSVLNILMIEFLKNNEKKFLILNEINEIKKLM